MLTGGGFAVGIGGGTGLVGLSGTFVTVFGAAFGGVTGCALRKEFLPAASCKEFPPARFGDFAEDFAELRLSSDPLGMMQCKCEISAKRYDEITLETRQCKCKLISKRATVL